MPILLLFSYLLPCENLLQPAARSPHPRLHTSDVHAVRRTFVASRPPRLPPLRTAPPGRVTGVAHGHRCHIVTVPELATIRVGVAISERTARVLVKAVVGAVVPGEEGRRKYV